MNASLEYSDDASPEDSLDPSLRARLDASSGYRRDTSLAAALDGSPRAALDASLRTSGDASLLQELDASRTCGWCGESLEGRDPRWIYCTKRCRQAAWRQRLLSRMEGCDGSPRRVAYADPPYPGMSGLYRGEPTYAGEVDHAALLRELAGFDGWALSTSARALRDVLPLCPREARVCAWVKPHGVSKKTRGLHNAWEPVIVMPARHLRPGVRDWFSALPARHGGTLPGRKPQRFCAQLFAWLGLRVGDELVDLYPGTRIVSRAWRELNRVSA